MTEPDAQRRLADHLGLLPAYHDIQGTLREMSPETRLALLAAMGHPCRSDSDAMHHLLHLQTEAARRLAPHDIIAMEGEAIPVPLSGPAGWRLRDDCTGAVLGSGPVAAEIVLEPLAYGLYHLELEGEDWSGRSLVIVRPRARADLLTLTGAPAIWGVTTALYGIRSDRNMGLGDYRDLADMARLLGGKGAGFLGINPVHALGAASRTISPYSPTHRGFFNTAHIAPDQVPLFARSPKAQALLAQYHQDHGAAGATPLIDHAAIAPARLAILEALFESFEASGDAQAFTLFCERQGEALHRFAIHETASEIHGCHWPSWPEGLRRPGSAEAQGFAARHARRLRFHKYLQFLADGQLQAAQAAALGAGMTLGLYLDIAVGVEPVSAEVWADPGVFTRGVSLGAPPDHFNPVGQRWGLAPYSPHALTAAGYAPFLRVLRATMRHAGLIRVDHALGLKRSFWVPAGDAGIEGGYVSYPFRSLLAIMGVEARRLDAVVIGEDLGVVPEGFRDELAAAGIHGCTIMQFERGHGGAFHSPKSYRPLSIASFGTHDTPTMRGFWQGRDIEWRRAVGHIDDDAAHHARNERAGARHMLLVLLEREGLLPEGMDIHHPPPDMSDALADALHLALARGASDLVAVQIEDALGEVEQPNLPGTIDAHPNWRRRHPVTLDGMPAHERLTRLAALMSEARPERRPAASRPDTP
jgi:4-alpha-glucanotransferase